MKTFMFTFLCISIFIKSSFQIHPRYSYVCKEDGNVEFTGFKANSNVTVVSNDSACASISVTTARQDQVVIIDKDCMGTNLTVDRQITVKVMDGNLNETGLHPTPSPGGIIGGLDAHSFVLKCTHISMVNRTVLRQFHLIDKETILSKENEIGQVDMRFKEDKNIDLPDISEVYIGDEFYMFLQYKGEPNYLIEPQNCTAFAGNDIFNSGVGKVTLWKIDGEKADHCVSQEAKNLNLLGSNGFTYVDDQTVRTRLNGFRFNTNVEDITIFCRVLLKLPSSASVKTNSIVCPQATTGRRKRSLHSGDTTSLSVMHTLSVKDRGNQGLNLGPHTVAHVFTIAASLLMIRIL